MTTSTRSRSRGTDLDRAPAGAGRRPARATRLVVALGVLLALAGAALAIAVMVPGHLSPPGLGDAVRTSAGTVTVTRSAATFVPDTQGPPSPEQHAGTVGTRQVQVWVRVVNDRSDRPVTVNADSLRLVLGSGTDPVAPDGSTIDGVSLPPRGVVDGQVWFDVPARDGQRDRSSWLAIDGSGSSTVRVPLNPSERTVAPHDHGPGEEEGHGHEDEE